MRNYLFILLFIVCPRAFAQMQTCGKLVAMCQPTSSGRDSFNCDLRLEGAGADYVLAADTPILSDLEPAINSTILLTGETYTGADEEPIFHIDRVEKVEKCPELKNP